MYYNLFKPKNHKLKKQSYRTLVKAIESISGKGSEARMKRLLSVYDAYSSPFNKINARLLFEDFPENFTWVSDKSFKQGDVVFSPRTIADFLSIMSSIDIDLTPRDGVFFLLFLNR